MRDIFTLFLHAIVTIIRFGQPGGLRSVVAESVLMRHQVLILNRGRKRAPNLRASDRIIAGLRTLLMRPARVLRSAVVLKTSTLLHFHKMRIKQKYRLLFSRKRVAQQLTLASCVDIDKDVVRRIPAIHFHPEAGSGGPSWLSFIGHAKDSLWSLDLFRCESAILRTYWVLVVMDQCTRRIVGFAVHRGVVDGVALCRMFNRAIHAQILPKYLSSDHDPLYRFHQWQANLRVLEVQEIKTVPYVPLSHPFVERLIESIRREYLDQTLFWTAVDLENKLRLFQDYFNRQRTQSGLGGRLPDPETARTPLNFSSYRWQQHCRGLYQTPIAA